MIIFTAETFMPKHPIKPTDINVFRKTEKPTKTPLFFLMA